MLLIHKPKCENTDVTAIRTSSGSHLHWKNYFHKNPLNFKIYADFEADNGIDKSSIGNKATNFSKQNPILNGYHIITLLEVVLKNGYYESPLGYNNVDWFVKEVIKLENKMTFYLKTTKKDIIRTKEDEEDFRKINICRFCEKNIEIDKVRDQCHLTGKYRRPAHSICNFNVIQKQSSFIPFLFHNFSNYDCHMLFKKYLIKRMIKSNLILNLKQMKNIYQ